MYLQIKHQILQKASNFNKWSGSILQTEWMKNVFLLPTNQLYLHQQFNAAWMQVQLLVFQRMSCHWCSSFSKQNKPLLEAKLGHLQQYKQLKINLCDKVLEDQQKCLHHAHHNRCALVKAHVLHSFPCSHKKESHVHLMVREGSKNNQQLIQLRDMAILQASLNRDLCEWCLPSEVTNSSSQTELVSKKHQWIYKMSLITITEVESKSRLHHSLWTEEVLIGETITEQFKVFLKKLLNP